MQISKIRSLYIVLFLTLSLSLFSSCSNDGQVLAEFDGGKITRGELRTLLSLYQDPEALKKIKLNQQSSTLNNYAMMKIASMQMKEEDLQKSSEYLKRSVYLDEWASIASLQKTIQSEVRNGPFEMMEIQFLFVRNDGPEAETKAKELLEKLNSGISDTEIEELIRDRSDNRRYAPLGGYMEPQCVSCTPNPLDFLTSSEEGSGGFKLKMEKSGIWIYRVLKRFTVKGNDLDDVYLAYYEKTETVSSHLGKKEQNEKDPAKQKEKLQERASGQAQGILRREERSAFPEKLNERKAELAFVLSEDLKNLNETPPGDDVVIFSTKKGNFTFKDLRAPLIKQNVTMPPQEELQLAQRIVIPYYLFNETPLIEKTRQSSIYSFIKTLKMNEVKAGVWMEQNRPEPEISEKEIQDWYEVRRNTEFKNKPLKDVKESIENRLKKTKFQEAFKEFQKKLVEDHHLIIHTDRLLPEGV